MTVSAWPLVAVVATIASAGLTVIAVRRRAVLAVVAGTVGLASAGVAAGHSRSGGEAPAALVIALVFVIIGAVLLKVGSTLWSLLDDAPDDPGE